MWDLGPYDPQSLTRREARRNRSLDVKPKECPRRRRIGPLGAAVFPEPHPSQASRAKESAYAGAFSPAAWASATTLWAIWPGTSS